MNLELDLLERTSDLLGSLNGKVEFDSDARNLMYAINTRIIALRSQEETAKHIKKMLSSKDGGS